MTNNKIEKAAEFDLEALMSEEYTRQENRLSITKGEWDRVCLESFESGFHKGAELERAKILAQLKAKFSGTMFEANVMSRVKDILEGR